MGLSDSDDETPKFKRSGNWSKVTDDRNKEDDNIKQHFENVSDDDDSTMSIKHSNTDGQEERNNFPQTSNTDYFLPNTVNTNITRPNICASRNFSFDDVN